MEGAKDIMRLFHLVLDPCVQVGKVDSCPQSSAVVLNDELLLADQVDRKWPTFLSDKGHFFITSLMGPKSTVRLRSVRKGKEEPPALKRYGASLESQQATASMACYTPHNSVPAGSTLQRASTRLPSS